MDKPDYKLLVIDIDGTLLSRISNVSPENKEALARVRQLGVQVSLSTGRALKACSGIIAQLSLDSYHISFDGALVSSPDLREKVYIQTLDRETVRLMIEFAHQNNIDLELFSTTQYFTERETWSTKAHHQFFGLEATIVDFDGLWERETIIKGGMAVTNPEEEAKMKSFYQQFSGRLHISQARTPAYPGIVFNNILALQVSKGKALEELAAYTGVPLAKVMAIGDGTNDIPLLKAAGLGIAMGNALSEVKAVADYVTLDVDHNGLAAAINRFLL